MSCNQPTGTRSRIIAIVISFAALTGIFTFLAYYGATPTLKVSQITPLNWVESALEAGKFDEVQRWLDNTKMQAYCYNLVGRRDLYERGVEQHNEVTHVFNKALEQLLRTTHKHKSLPASFENGMTLLPNNLADANRLVFLGYPDPREHCRQYGVFDFIPNP